MTQFLKHIFSKRKFQYFLFVHFLFVVGLLMLDITVAGLLLSLLLHILVVAPISTLITHLKFNHNYIKFKNSIFEWAGLAFMCTYSFFKFTDVKSYHVCHHQYWLTPSDPTASEIAQGKIKYYLGLTEPCTVPKFEAMPDSKINFASQNFYLIKLSIYLIIILLFGINAFFYSIIAQQFYFYALTGKLHDMAFHSNLDAVDKPWLFPLYFNDSWHVEHHREYAKLNSWHWPCINVHYWFYKLFFKQDTK